MTKLELLTQLKDMLAKAKAAGVLTEMVDHWGATDEIVNEFCDAVSVALAHEREMNQEVR